LFINQTTSERKEQMKKYKVMITETNVWSTEVKAKNKKDAVKKAEDVHSNGTMKGGGRDAYTFENYLDEDNRLDFQCEDIKSNLYQG